MFKTKQIWSGIITLGLLLGASDIAIAQQSEKSLKSSDRFRRIEQPKGVQVGVTLGGLALIGAEMWWFLFSKNQAQKAQLDRGINKGENRS